MPDEAISRLPRRVPVGVDEIEPLEPLDLAEMVLGRRVESDAVRDLVEFDLNPGDERTLGWDSNVDESDTLDFLLPPTCRRPSNDDRSKRGIEKSTVEGSSSIPEMSITV